MCFFSILLFAQGPRLLTNEDKDWYRLYSKFIVLSQKKRKFLWRYATLMIITHINLILPVCSLIGLSKSARIFIPDRALPLVYHFFVFILLLGLQDLTRGNQEEEPAKLRGYWHYLWSESHSC